MQLELVCFLESEMSCAQDAVGCLPATGLRTLAKSLHINCSSMKKDDIVDAVVKHSQRPNVSSFFTSVSNTTEKMILKRFVIATVNLSEACTC